MEGFHDDDGKREYGQDQEVIGGVGREGPIGERGVESDDMAE